MSPGSTRGASGHAYSPGKWLPVAEEADGCKHSLLEQTHWFSILRAAKGLATPFSPASVVPSEQRSAAQGKNSSVTPVLASAIMDTLNKEEEQG